MLILLAEKVGKYFLDLGAGKDFLNKTSTHKFSTPPPIKTA